MLNFEFKKISNLGPESLQGWLYFTKEEGDLMEGAGHWSRLGRQKGTDAFPRSSGERAAAVFAAG